MEAESKSREQLLQELAQLRREIAELRVAEAERAHVVEAVRQREARYRVASELTADFAYAFRIEPDGTYVPEWMTEGFAELLGITLDEVNFPADFGKIIHPDDLPHILESFQEHLAGKLYDAEFRVITEDSKMRWLHVYGRPEWDATQNRVVRTIGAARDITAQKQAEEALQESELRFRNAFDHAAIGRAIADPGGNFIRTNKSFCEMMGYTEGEMLQKSWQEITHADDLQKSSEFVIQLMAGEIPSFRYVHRLIRKDGRYIWVDLTVILVRDSHGNPLYMVGDIVDITERMRVEQELKKTRDNLEDLVEERTAKLRATTIVLKDEIRERSKAEERVRKERDRAQQYLNLVEVMVVTLNRTGNITLINRKGCEILGYEEKELTGENWFDTCLPASNREDVESVVRSLFAGEIEAVEYYENPVLTKSGEERIIAWHNTVLVDEEGNIYGTLGAGEDISEQMRAEQELQKYHDQLEDLVKERTAALTRSNEQLQQEIEERIKIEEALRESEARYRSMTEDVIDTSIVGIFILDKDFKVVWINRALEQLFSVHRKGIIGKDKRQLIRERIKNIFEKPDEFEARVIATYDHNNYVENFECHVLPHAERQERWLEHWSQPIHSGLYAGGRIEHYSDITVRKRAEDAMRESEQKHRSLFETMIQGVVYQAADGQITSANPAAEKILGLTLDQMSGRTSADPRWKAMKENGADFPSEIHPSMIALKTGKEVRDVIMRVFNPLYGENRWININAVPQFRPGERAPYQVYTTFSDITERKLTDEELKTALAEKEVLLKEIHHRVKNNFQVIDSLLEIQAYQIRDQRISDVLKESQSRIKSMGLVHQMLYQSTSLAEVNFTSYIHHLTRHLFSTYNVNPDVVSLHVDMLDVSLNIDTAIPCGLIINELITNSLKYAFPGEGGEIRVTLKTQDGEHVLMVSDNGVGLPEGMDWRKTETLGLQLVNTLTGQLRGEIELDRREGAEFKIIFPAEERER